MNTDCETCRDVTCSHCGFHGYRSLTPGWENPYRCPTCWLTTGLSLTPVRHSTRGKHYQWLPLSRDRHCPTCRCGRDSDPAPAKEAS